jgi:hypothetical protein
MSYRFSGIWDFKVTNKEVSEDNDYDFLCEDPLIDVNNEIDFDIDIKEFVIENKDFTTLDDGYYHCYLEGVLWWEYDKNYEFGIMDCDLYTNINYFNIIKYNEI